MRNSMTEAPPDDMYNLAAPIYREAMTTLLNILSDKLTFLSTPPTHMID